MNTTYQRLRATLLPVLAIFTIWALLCAMGAFGGYSDHARRGSAVEFGEVFGDWWRTHFLLALLTCASHEFYRRRPAAATSARSLALAYAVLVLCFVPLQVLYSSYADLVSVDKPVSLAAMITNVGEATGFRWFMEFTWTTFTFTAVVGVCNWREARTREQAWSRSQSENLNLRLELEQQRLLALRGQLNPHFLFNSLNAISALVRSHDSKLALTGIGHLSDLLRYALQASEREHVSLIDERQFVDDYLALQKMRYGARLQVHIDGDDSYSLAGDVPPLLLQPLIENALRHDLDCHEGHSDIRLAFGGDDERLTISVSNPASEARTTNPGLGLGLRHSRARLQLAYGAAATLKAGLTHGRFVVEISMPRHALAA